MWRRIQECGFAKRYRDHVDFAYYIKMINALAFVPETYMDDRIEDLLLITFLMENRDDIAEIVYYLEDNSIGRQRTTRR